MYKRCRLEEPQRLPLFIQEEFSVEVCCGIIRALQSFQTQVENFPLETSFKHGSGGARGGNGKDPKLEK